MRRLSVPLAAVLAAGCAAGPSGPWRYESIVWERRPEIRSPEDARAQFERLSSLQELTLEACYAMALFRSEALAIDGEELARLQAQYERALAAVQPTIAFRGTYTRRDDAPPTGSLTSFRLEEQTEYRFNLRQPIFSGLREFHAIRASDALQEAREHGLRHARLLLFADVADAFYTALRLERETQTTGGSLRVAQERLEELVQRNKVGISRRSEVLAQEAEVASIQAQLEAIRGAHAVSWQVLRFLTGLAETRALADILEPPQLPPVEPLIQKALTGRSDIKELEADLRSAEAAVSIAAAGHLPTLSLEANYYTHRVGVSEGIDWDALVTLEVPLYAGGSVGASVREAESNARAAKLRLEGLVREVGLRVRRVYVDVESLRSELQSREKALASAKENHDIVQAEYRGGIATNLEVLTAFNAMRRAEFERDRARFSLKVAYARLAVETGELPEGVR